MEIFAETKRLILREILPEDLEGMFALEADTDVHKYLGNNPIKSKEEAQKNIDFIRQQYRENNIGRWAVIEKETDNFIGWAGLKFIREETNQHINYYDIGYRLIKKYWGKGYATEAAKASLLYGFEELHLQEIFAIADCENVASNNILTKIGMVRVEDFSLNGINHNWYCIKRQDILR